ncbi:hypothetical protein OWR29_14330 [Actinoplanes sp. Pm04-4]|jgi:hypothetical protein|uniref:Uncharacterized protein n=1 Tax=Paractinoplanes pyxinae TaxID=2997416 RepID=A0ABT4AY51_9ACTN|nr:hypothetical protein [Actinoplanes pyxinae]MCY1139172.1 hypothetical protein [Actinoplanes pyxinae]
MTYGKKDLPYPYCADFSGIVTRVKGVRESTRAALVNSLKVASYLKAGANLIERNLGAQRPATATGDGRKQYWSGLSFLTERALSAEVEELELPFLRQKGAGPYRSTWASHDDYLNDLLAFMLHAINYDPQYGADVETRGDWLATDESFVDAVDRSSYHELMALCRMPLFKLQLIMVATAHRNDGIRSSIANNYAGALEPWMKIYEETIAARGYRLRPGITIQEFSNLLAAVTEGLAVRHLGDPSVDIADHGPTENLVGKGVLGLMAAYLEPVDEPSGLTLRELFERSAKNNNGGPT